MDQAFGCHLGVLPLGEAAVVGTSYTLYNFTVFIVLFKLSKMYDIQPYSRK